MKKKIVGTTLAVAAALAFVVAPVATTMAAEMNDGAKMAMNGCKVKCMESNKCKGMGSCKGMTSCKTTMNSCKGKNSCKNHVMMMKSKKACKKMGGTVEK